ncbi:hypothetical protein BGW37DRAFT_93487 [Umbelopsis sp. PMI_123]|nr:hypothetical protein BGW37DRAFT_93487 [Umbelopsis sp. PMI_123]
MVVQCGDICNIPSPKKYMGDKRTVRWSQDWGTQKAVDFCFIPFTCPKDDTGAFLAVEIARMGEFQKLCKKKESDPDDWSAEEDSYEFTVDNRFKYGQNNEQTWRFLVFQNPDYKPFQHRFSEVADSTDAMTFLGNLSKSYGKYATLVPDGDSVLSVLKAVIGDDLHSF